MDESKFTKINTKTWDAFNSITFTPFSPLQLQKLIICKDKCVDDWQQSSQSEVVKISQSKDFHSAKYNVLKTFSIFAIKLFGHNLSWVKFSKFGDKFRKVYPAWLLDFNFQLAMRARRKYFGVAETNSNHCKFWMKFTCFIVILTY